MVDAFAHVLASPQTRTPHLVDLWTGRAEQVAEYRPDGRGVTVPLCLRPGQTAVIAFDKAAPTTEHVVAADAEELRQQAGHVTVLDSRSGAGGASG